MDQPFSRHRTTITFVVAVVVLLAVSLLTHQSTLILVKSVEQARAGHGVIDHLRDIVSFLKDAQTIQRGYLLTGDAGSIPAFDAATDLVEQSLRHVRQQTAGYPDQRARCGRLDPLVSEQIAQMRSTLDTGRTEGIDTARRRLRPEEDGARMERILRLTVEMEQAELAALEAHQQRLARRSETTAVVFGAGTIVSCGLLIGVFVSLRREMRARRQAEAELATKTLFQSSIDALTAHIAVLDEQGTILFVNEAWRRFADANGFRGPSHGVGLNYVGSCENLAATDAAENGVAQGIRELIAMKRREFRIEYPCHSPEEMRWFQVRGTSFLVGGAVRIVLAHENVTDVKRQEEELRQLSARLIQLQDEERRRIARELHDSTAQNLSAANLNLARLQGAVTHGDDRAREALADTTSLVEQSLREIRTLSYLLHPPMLDEAGLVSALGWFIDGFRKRSGIDVRLDVMPGLDRLPSEQEAALFRVVQESLNNIQRHSGSPRATIQLIRTSREVMMEIMDEGKGMSQASSSAHDDVGTLGVGIRGMRERLRQLGGRLEIESGAHGTRVRAILPWKRGSAS